MVAVVVAAVAIAVATAIIGGGWSKPGLETWDKWLGNVQKLVTIVGIAGAAYVAYRRFLSGGSVLTARCELELDAALVRFRSGGSMAVVITCCISNEGGVDLVLVRKGERPVVEVFCLDDTLIVQGEADRAYPWIKGYLLAGLPFRGPTGALDHDDIEPGSKIQSTVALPVPTVGGPYQGFYIRFLVEAHSANDPESRHEYSWTSDTVLFDADPATATGNP